MGFPFSMDRASQFQILGVWGGTFHFYFKKNEKYHQTP